MIMCGNCERLREERDRWQTECMKLRKELGDTLDEMDLLLNRYGEAKAVSNKALAYIDSLIRELQTKRGEM